MQFRSAFQIATGLGAGNIGDDLAARALWRQLPADWQLHIAVFDNYTRHREPYPSRYAYYLQSPGPIENAWVRDMPGLFAGSIFERPGSGWPLPFLAPRLQHFHEHGLPIDAVGVSVEPLVSADARRLFDRCCLPFRSWTVRDDYSRDALLAMGVEPARIAIGADWAWLYESPVDHSNWAAATWRGLKVDPSRPLLAVNASGPRGLDAAALDKLHRRHGFQIAFINLDFRHPGLHRTSAEATRASMKAPSVLVPNEYYSPGELIALLRHSTVAVSAHIPFGLAAILAGAVPVFLGACPSDIGLNTSSPNDLVDALCGAYANRESTLDALAAVRSRLRARAMRNLDFFALFNGLTP